MPCPIASYRTQPNRTHLHNSRPRGGRGHVAECNLLVRRVLGAAVGLVAQLWKGGR